MPDIEQALRHGVPLVVGIVLISVSGWAYRRDQAELEHSIEVRGTVVENVRERDGDNWAPVVEFEVNGARLRKTGAFSSTRAANGSAFTVRYDPTNPSNTARVIGALEPLALPGAFVLGLMALLSGVVGFLRQSAQQRKPVE